MSNIDKLTYRADGGDICTGRLKEIADNPYGDEEKCWMAKRMLALLDELEAKDRRIEEEIGRANREHHRGFMMACGHLKEHSNIHYADATEMEIAALRKRINELESAPPVPVVHDEVMPGGLVYSSALPKFESNDSDKVVGYSCFISGDTRIVESQEQAYSDAKAVVNACRAAMLQGGKS